MGSALDQLTYLWLFHIGDVGDELRRRGRVCNALNVKHNTREKQTGSIGVP